MANYGKATITGVDLAADKKVAISDVLIDLSARYSYQKAQDVTDNKSKLYKSQIPYTPLHSGSGSVAIKYNDWAANVTAILSGKRYFLEYNIPDNEIENYAEFSASISRNFKIKDVDFSLKFSCINFTNCQYDVIKYYPMPGRQFQLNLSLTL
jgi:outer membrane cobalamin receptor